ncbi:putative MFS family arabinose efflux permease [Neolewinella xylanilytica]|uniref:Putative MFS family arabinose efflux permease n=1 Tax=Neolewinella xylanilytica TaxID=1514080 RepID=A0A2S6I771_9BACT|nr:MFS transporter [Neolewinella xylanilytica]PPK87366.1 putative MFS family arabinose efflux permease [Neolewinella xylanilytica]
MQNPDAPKLGWPLWLFVTATLVSNIGTWLFTVGSSWLMTELDGSALMVGLVQTATMVPLFFFALPAGALGDVYDRRLNLLISQGLLILSTAIFAWIVYAGQATVTLLLVFTFFNGLGAAFSRPLMSAIIPQLVPKPLLRSAVNLGGISFNLSRAIGPVLGGYLITRYTLDLPYWVDAVSFLTVWIYVWFWRDDRENLEHGRQPPLRLAMGDAVRFYRHSPALRDSTLRAVSFFFSASALWALLPLIARERLSGEADLYGYLVGAAGAGAVAGGVLLGGVTRRLNANRMIFLAGGVMAAGLAVLGWSTSVTLSVAAVLACGAAWQTGYTTVMTSTQYSLPRWFGARGLAFYLMSTSACLAVGSAAWGWIADLTTLATSHYIAAGSLLALTVLGRGLRLDQASGFDLSAGDPLFSEEANDDTSARVPQLVRTTYTFPSHLREPLLDRLAQLAGSRYRSGALRRRIAADPDADRIDEEVWLILGAPYAGVRMQTTRHDADMQQEFEKWLSDNGGEWKQEMPKGEIS